MKWNSLDAVKFNFIPLVTRFAKAVLVHSRYHQAVLKDNFYGPSDVVYFPHKATKENFEVNVEKSDKIELLTVGNVNYNKRIAQIITSIGHDDELKRKVHYTIAGKLDGDKYEKLLKDLITEFHLKNSVTLKGFTSAEELKKLYAQSDVLMNLRKPAIEGASWSLVEQMDLGKPIVVTNVGFYSEIPDDCLIKIDGDGQQEISNIGKSLHWIIENQEQANRMGSNAKEFLDKTFSPKIYTEKVELFLHRMEFLKPLNQLASRLIYEMASIRITSDMKICNTISEELEEMFSNKGAPMTFLEVINEDRKQVF